MRTVILLSFGLLLFSVAYAQTSNIKKLDSLFDILQMRELATGSVAISVDGKIIYRKAIGFSSLDGNKKVLPDINTKYRIGSVSKMFTAVIIFQLIEEGKLSLHDKLITWFPDLPNAGKITIEQMLYHRSGLHDYTQGTNFSNWMDKPATERAMLNIITDNGPDFEPGAKAAYSNTNYLVLSYIIEKVDRQPYSSALNKRIIKKLQLPNTSYAKPIDIKRNESISYKYADSTWKKQKETDPGIHMGAGSLVSTPSDLVIFIHKLFTNQLISRTNLAKMTAIKDDYGMGIFPNNFNSARGYGHNGRIEEFYTAVRYYPDQKLAVSYITNGILYPRIDILEGILKICLNEGYTIPFYKPVALQSSELDKYLGEYSGDLPFKVICRKTINALTFEAGGRTMTAEAVAKDYFMNLKTGTFFQFKPQRGELQIKETDNVYYLLKK